MSRDPDYKNANEDAILERLIRASRLERAEGFVRPDDDAVTAYLMGTATTAQEEAVKTALSRSPSFRREILDMAQDIDALEDSSLPAVERSLVGMVPPSRHEFLKARSGPVDDTAAPQTFWTKIVGRRIPQFYAPVALVTTLLVLIVLWTAMFTPYKGQPVELAQLCLDTENVEIGLLVTNITRKAADEAGDRIYATAREAALAECRFLLTYRSGEFTLNPPFERPEPTFPHRRIALIFEDQTRERIADFRARVPHTGTMAPDRIQAWVLSLPSRELRQIRVGSDSTSVRWTDDLGSRGCLTFTFPYEDGYRATVGSTFKLD